MKRVSFEVAKAIKEVGYPQKGNAHSTYYDEQYKETFIPFECNRSRDYLAPTYLEVWLWLWREKHIEFAPTHNSIEFAQGDESLWLKSIDIPELATKTDPEEAIIKAIEYLVENNLIK